MVMDPSLPTVLAACNESRAAISVRDGKHGYSSSSIKLLKAKPGVSKRSPDLAPKGPTQGQWKTEPARRSVTKLLLHTPEKVHSSGSERPRKSIAEKPKRIAKDKQEMEALVRKLSTPSLGASRPPAMQVPEKPGAKAFMKVEVKSPEFKLLPGQNESCKFAPQDSVGLRLEISNDLEGQPLYDVPAARKSRNTTPDRRPSNACQSDTESEDVATFAPPLTPSRLMPLMPVSAIDAVMNDESQGSNSHLGPYLIKLTKLYSMGEDQFKAIEYGIRALRFYEKRTDNGQPSIEFIVSLQILAALYGRLGNFDDAIPLLERSVVIPVTGENEDHALAKFCGHMQLGDSFNLLGKQSAALESYHRALRVQKAMLGDMDPRVGESCHYIAEAHLQALDFDKAEALCEHALRIHKEHGEEGSLEEAADRRLMALVLSAKGNHDNALENLTLALTTLQANHLELDAAAVSLSMGDELLALGRDAEAVNAYQKSILMFKALKGDNHTLVAGCYVSLAELYVKTNKNREAKSFCENAIQVYGKQGSGHNPNDIASGFADVAAVYEQMNEKDAAILLLQRALKIQESLPGHQAAIGGIEAQMGILYYMMEKYGPALDAFKGAACKLRDGGLEKTPLLGMLLNQMGITCVELGDVEQAADLFENSRSILEDTYGPYHLDTLDVCTNLAGSYDALGRLDEATQLLEDVLQSKEEKLGTVHPDVHDDRERLQELLKDVGRTYTPKSRRLEELLLTARKENRKR
jgi:tetratricopeptide (TPR) repeat protein